MSLYLNYLPLGFVWPQSSTMCFASWYIGNAFSQTIVILLAWISIERHILVFHNQLVFTEKKSMVISLLSNDIL